MLGMLHLKPFLIDLTDECNCFRGANTQIIVTWTQPFESIATAEENWACGSHIRKNIQNTSDYVSPKMTLRVAFNACVSRSMHALRGLNNSVSVFKKMCSNPPSNFTMVMLSRYPHVAIGRDCSCLSLALSISQLENFCGAGNLSTLGFGI